MSDEEPLYCRVCGAEDCWCDHDFEDVGPYCDVCGIIPAPGFECMFMKADGRRDRCKGPAYSVETSRATFAAAGAADPDACAKAFHAALAQMRFCRASWEWFMAVAVREAARCPACGESTYHARYCPSLDADYARRHGGIHSEFEGDDE